MKNSMNPAVVKVTAKCSDLCFTQVVDANDNVIAEHDGYVPEFMPGEHYGDYVELKIDIATGKLLNWKPGSYLHKFIKQNEV
jgi:hypothetical protein